MSGNAVWQVKIDYVSLTSGLFHVWDVATGEQLDEPRAYALAACRNAGLHALCADGADAWAPTGGRSFYGISATHRCGARLFWRNPNARPLLELGGAACDVLAAAGELIPLIAAHIESVTRLDLAGDYITEMKPAEFLAAGMSARHTTRSSVVSATGETEYIGSPSSDRRCRVYRYAPPHPRAAALRVEVVSRREQAKFAASLVATDTLVHAWRSQCAPFDFRAGIWRDGETSITRMPTLKDEKSASQRLAWLTKQVRPALLQAHADGLIDLRTWLVITPEEEAPAN